MSAASVRPPTTPRAGDGVASAPVRILLLCVVAVIVSACSAPRYRAVSTVPPEQATAPAAPAPAGGCASERAGGGYYLDDGPGDRPPPDLDTIADAVPRAEPVAARASRPYAVFGRDYVPMTAIAPFRERGVASWYGCRYHGRKTSIGEVYDMYAMTGAHPTLPLPSYVRVTRLSNGRSVVVRLNDRGPFLRDRVIDLSYVAAAKLGYTQAGSAEVEVELITRFDGPTTASGAAGAQVAAMAPPSTPATTAAPVTGRAEPATVVPPGPQRLELETVATPALSATPAVAPAPAAAVFLQLGAFGTRDNAQAARERVARAAGVAPDRLSLRLENGLHKLHYGPFAARGEALAEAGRIRRSTGGPAIVVER